MARKNNDSKLLEEIIEDLNVYTHNIGRLVAGRIRDELAETAYEAINEFYNDYTPHSYQRHLGEGGEHFNFAKHSFEKVYRHNAGSSLYVGGIRLTPELLYDIYRADREFIFDLVYSGYHGIASEGTVCGDPNKWAVKPVPIGTEPYSDLYTFKITRPSPMERILSKQKYILDHINEYVSDAERQAYSMSKYV